MLAIELIQHHIIHLVKGEHPLEGLTLLRSAHLPSMIVVDDISKFPIGIINESELITLLENDQKIGDTQGNLIPMVSAEAHIFDVIKLFQAHKVNVIPVIDSEQKYMGTITRDSAYTMLSEMLHTNRDGAVISILIRPQNFVLSDIIRRIEEEKVKVLGTTIEYMDKPETLVRLSLKIDQNDTKRVIASLNRFDLVILSDSSKSYDEEFAVKADEFLHFLNI